MNPRSAKEAITLFKAIKKNVPRGVQAVIAAPAIYLPHLSKLTSASLKLAAQDVSDKKDGAYTGQTAAGMLKGEKVSYVLIGHSERRALGETNEMIAEKIKQTLAAGLTPVLCVGEQKRDMTMWYLSEVQTQLTEGLSLVAKSALSKMVIAYEPVWAISSTENRRDATPEDFEEMSIYIRKVLVDTFSEKQAHDVPIIYGGSVNEKNAQGFLEAGAMGLLPGKASLTAKKFTGILNVAHEVR